ncbi:DUF3923 family protein [Solibacillus sp. CAU 1738]|uniref:DUF3923 family protein n=1 Tax=Solibacillus sp. CAU 1738 TaxID=3140363 RepID=UPI0032611AC3
MELWWTTSLIWLVLFGATAIFIGVRKVDGSGVEQTPELRLVALIILGVAFVFILLCQLVFLYFVRKRKSVSAH